LPDRPLTEFKYPI